MAAGRRLLGKRWRLLVRMMATQAVAMRPRQARATGPRETQSGEWSKVVRRPVDVIKAVSERCLRVASVRCGDAAHLVRLVSLSLLAEIVLLLL